MSKNNNPSQSSNKPNQTPQQPKSHPSRPPAGRPTLQGRPTFDENPSPRGMTKNASDATGGAGPGGR